MLPLFSHPHWHTPVHRMSHIPQAPSLRASATLARQRSVEHNDAPPTKTTAAPAAPTVSAGEAKPTRSGNQRYLPFFGLF